MRFKGVVGEGRFTLGSFFRNDIAKMLKVMRGYDYVLDDSFTDVYSLFYQMLLSPHSLFFTGKDEKQVGFYVYYSVIIKNHQAMMNVCKKKGMSHELALTCSLLSMSFMFENFNLDRLYITLCESNKAAMKFAEKLGFVPEGRLRRAAKFNGEYHNILVCGLLKEEFK